MNISQNTNNSNLLGSGQRPRIDTRVRSSIRTATDVAFLKVEPLGGRRTLMLRFEIINALNNPDLQSPNTAFGNSNFGRITQVGGFPRML